MSCCVLPYFLFLTSTSEMEFAEKAPSNNKTFCCVYGCDSKASRNRKLSFHLFPKMGVRSVAVENPFGQSEKIDLHKAWILKLNMGKPPSKFMRVCSLHFKASDYCAKDLGVTGGYLKRYLKKNAVPSQNLPKSSANESTVSRMRILLTKPTVDFEKVLEHHDVEDLVHKGDEEFPQEMEYSVDEITAARNLLLLRDKQDADVDTLNMENAPTYYKYCIIPMCINTTVKTPEKIFIRIPEEPKRRKQWVKACGKELAISLQSRSRAYVCEDHFNLEEDMKNYLKYKLVGGKITLKDNVVPHIFEFESDRKRTSAQVESTIIERMDRGIADDAASSTSVATHTGYKEKSVVGTQIEEKTYRDIGILVKPHFRSKCVQC